MPNAKDYNPRDNGILCGVAGMSGKGKSTLILSMAEVGKTAVALTDGSELDLYGGHDIEYDVFLDRKWQPLARKWGATDFHKLLTWMDVTSQRDDIRCIGIDHGSGGTTSPGVSELAMHDALATHEIANPLELPHGQAYAAHANNMRYFLDACKLAAWRGKHVVCSFLVQLREDETSPNRDETLLPAVHGSIRQHIAASFSLWLHAYTIGSNTSTKYLVRAVQSAKQPAKSRLRFKNLQQASQLPNNLKAILEAMA